jgi:hypothetical protein
MHAPDLGCRASPWDVRRFPRSAGGRAPAHAQYGDGYPHGRSPGVSLTNSRKKKVSTNYGLQDTHQASCIYGHTLQHKSTL